MDERQFVIQYEGTVFDRPPLALDGKDTLGIIGELLSAISQMDPGDVITIECAE